MDPNATLTLIADHVRDGNMDEARHARQDLHDWIKKGGFRPEVAPCELLALLETYEKLTYVNFLYDQSDQANEWIGLFDEGHEKGFFEAMARIPWDESECGTPESCPHGHMWADQDMVYIAWGDDSLDAFWVVTWSTGLPYFAITKVIGE